MAPMAIHIAEHDPVPLIMFIGQVERGMRGRGAFQEMDYERFFASTAKWVTEIDDPQRIPEVVARAFHIALQGRPGPVVISLPEDMLVETASVADAWRVEAGAAAPGNGDLARLAELLAQAEATDRHSRRQRLVARGLRAFRAFAEAFDLPVAASFRRTMLFNGEHANYAGEIEPGRQSGAGEAGAEGRSRSVDRRAARRSAVGKPIRCSTCLCRANGWCMCMRMPLSLAASISPHWRSTPRRRVFAQRSARWQAPQTLPWSAETKTARADYLASLRTPIRQSPATCSSTKSCCGCASVCPPMPSSPMAPAITPPGLRRYLRIRHLRRPAGAGARARWAMACRRRSARSGCILIA